MKVASLKNVPSTSRVLVSVEAGLVLSAGMVMCALALLSHCEGEDRQLRTDSRNDERRTV